MLYQIPLIVIKFGLDIVLLPKSRYCAYGGAGRLQTQPKILHVHDWLSVDKKILVDTSAVRWHEYTRPHGRSARGEIYIYICACTVFLYRIYILYGSDNGIYPAYNIIKSGYTEDMILSGTHCIWKEKVPGRSNLASGEGINFLSQWFSVLLVMLHD